MISTNRCTPASEKQTIVLLPKLAEGTYTGELKRSFLNQVKGCRTQSNMLDRLLKEAGTRDFRPVCLAMKALLRKCSELLKSLPPGNLRDTVIIAHIQRAEHYKMAAYSSVHDYAKLFGDHEAADALDNAAKSVLAVSKNLGQIAIQVNAEAYVDTRIGGT